MRDSHSSVSGSRADRIFPNDYINKIFHEDCLELMKQLPDEVVSLILTDPPYGIRYQNQFSACPYPILDGDTGIDYMKFAKESYRILKPNSHAYFFTRFDCYPHHFHCLKKAGFSIKNCLVIEKGTLGGIGDLKGSFANNAEWIIFCQKGRRVFNTTTLLKNRKKEGTLPRKGRTPHKKYKTRFPTCWFGAEYPKSTYNAMWQKKHKIFHPTIKNTECLAWLIQISSNPGDLVFDGFAGVASTALAAMQTGRCFLGAEISENYWSIGQKRLKENNEREPQKEENPTASYVLDD